MREKYNAYSQNCCISFYQFNKCLCKFYFVSLFQVTTVCTMTRILYHVQLAHTTMTQVKMTSLTVSTAHVECTVKGLEIPCLMVIQTNYTESKIVEISFTFLQLCFVPHMRFQWIELKYVICYIDSVNNFLVMKTRKYGLHFFSKQNQRWILWKQTDDGTTTIFTYLKQIFPGDCVAGYYCEGGANVTAPSPSAAYPLNDQCPPGHYCPSGTKYWVQCPPGTYRPSAGESTITLYKLMCFQQLLKNKSQYCLQGQSTHT